MKRAQYVGLSTLFIWVSIGCEPDSNELEASSLNSAEILVEEEVLDLPNLQVNQEVSEGTFSPDWSKPATLFPNPQWTENCLGLEPNMAVHCSEAKFWPAFQDGLDDREFVFDEISAVIDEHGEGFSARIHFLRALLGVAIQTENSGEDSLITPYILTMKPDLDLACEIEPENAFYNTWRHSGDLILAMMLEKEELLEEYREASFAHAESSYKNLMGIMSTWVAFPLDSGLPQAGLPLMREWIENGHLEEIDNDWHRPYTQVGFLLMLGDMFSRMGELEEARLYLEQCLTHPDAARWPYRFLAEDLLDNLESTVASYLALPDDEAATEMMISWGEFSCRMCHTSREEY